VNENFTFACICFVIIFVNSEPSRVTWKYKEENIIVSPDLTDKSLQISVEHEKIQRKPTPLK
jgi:hypothetical protein